VVVRVAAVALLLVLGLLAIPMGVQAASDGSSFVGTDGTLYVHITRTGGLTTWVNTLADDPANEGSDDGWNVLGFALGGGTHVADFPMTPALSAPVAFTKGADVTFDLWIGGSGPDQNGQVTVTASLLSGSTVVAETAASSSVQYMGDMHEVTLTAPAQVDGLAAGDALTLHLEFDGIGTFIHVGNGDPTQSKVTLPIIPSAEPSGPTTEALSGPTVTLATTLANTTSRVDTYNWTAPAGPLLASYDATVGNGTIAVSITDAENHTVERNLTATGNGSAPLGDLAPGNWTITVAYTGFDGTFHLAIAPAAAATDSAGPSSAAASATNGTAGPGTNSTASTPGDTKGSPGLGMLGFVGVVAVAAAIAARRRRT
jgi:MYXO-CTERM domain-containing protein